MKFGQIAGDSVIFADVFMCHVTFPAMEGVIEYSNKSDYENAVVCLNGLRLLGSIVNVQSMT